MAQFDHLCGLNFISFSENGQNNLKLQNIIIHFIKLIKYINFKYYFKSIELCFVQNKLKEIKQ